MFDSSEIQKLRQDVDGLSEQVAMLIETQEVRHAEIMNKFELLEEKIGSAISGADIEDLKSAVESVSSEVEEVAEAVHSIDEHLEEKQR